MAKKSNKETLISIKTEDMLQSDKDKFTTYPYKIIIHHFLADGNRMRHEYTINNESELEVIYDKVNKNTNTFTLFNNNVVKLISSFSTNSLSKICFFFIPSSLLDTDLETTNTITAAKELLGNFDDVENYFSNLS